MARQGGNKPVTELEDLEVQEVSIVDRPANKRRFITVKNEDGMGDKGTPIKTGENGELTTKGDGGGSGSGGDGAPGQGGGEEAFPVLDLNAVFKRLSVPADMRSEIFRQVSDSMTRLNGVLAQVDVASVDRDGKSDSQLVPVLGNELGEIAKIVGDLSKKLNRSSASKGDDKGQGTGDDAPPAKGDGNGEPSDFEKKLGELVKTVETEAEEMNKAGRKMASRRLGEFKDAMNVLGKILTELTGEQAKGDGDGSGGGSDKTEKRIGNLEKSLQESIDRAKGLADVVKTQKAEIETLKNARGVGNAIPVEKSSPTTGGDDAGDWPLDMNDEKSRDSVDKSTSFYD